MQRLSDQDVLTTGEVAKICHVAPRTVSKWVDSGQLRGYRIPGSRDRRVPVGHLRAFLRAHGIPSETLAEGPCRVLIVAAEVPGGLAEALAGSGRFEVRTAATAFAAGLAVQQFRPGVIVLDAQELAQAVAIVRQVRSVPELEGIRIVAVLGASDSAEGPAVPAGLFDLCLSRPWSVWQVVRAIEEATSRNVEQ